MRSGTATAFCRAGTDQVALNLRQPAENGNQSRYSGNAGFVEGFRQADKFLEVAKLAAERGKPIVLIKIGRSNSERGLHARILQR